MKNFFTSMLGALVALFVFTFLALILLVGIVGAIVSIGARHAATAASIDRVEDGSYLVLDLSANITDSPPVFSFDGLGGDRPATLQLRTVTRAIRRAAGDSRIAGILIDGSLSPSGYGSGYAALREVRAALLDFRRSGKPVRAFLDQPTLKDYYVASAAKEIDLEPYSALFLPGLAAEPIFVAGALQKYGVDVQVSRVGKYKSAVEMFTRTDMSPDDRVQLQQLLGSIWKDVLAEIAAQRGVAPSAIQDLVDSQGLIRAEAAREHHLVDRVLFRDQVIAELRKAAGTEDIGPAKTFKQIALPAYARLTPEGGRGSPNEIAVVYAEGEIVDGDGGSGQVGGRKFSAELRRLRQDDAVKAVVLRVNSPGGSVTASEEIERELLVTRQVKPVIVSMGAYAASGGYWISADADRIFAEPTTITGSIGVFDLQFDVQKLFGDWGVTFDRVKTGRFADSETITRPKTPEEMAVVQNEVDWIYGKFIDKVADGRHLARAKVEDIAQGRVWSGRDARRLGLVDQFGGLAAAIQYAGLKAGIGNNFHLVEYPSTKDLTAQFLEMIDRLASRQAHASAGGVVDRLASRVGQEISELKAFNDPRGLYARLPIELEADR